MVVGIQTAMPVEMDAMTSRGNSSFIEENGGASFYHLADGVVGCVGGVGKVNAADRKSVV